MGPSAEQSSTPEEPAKDTPPPDEMTGDLDSGLTPGGKALKLVRRCAARAKERSAGRSKRKCDGRLKKQIRTRKTEAETPRDQAAALLEKLGPGKEAILEVIHKLFDKEDPQRLTYHLELEKEARRLNLSPGDLLRRAVGDLSDTSVDLMFDQHGRISNADAIGTHFSSVMSLISRLVDVRIITPDLCIGGACLPLSSSYGEKVARLTQTGECAIFILTHVPPKSAVNEIENITRDQLGGVWQLWAEPQIRDKLHLSDALNSYLEHATVRVMITGGRTESAELADQINKELEQRGKFEDIHWVRVVHSIAKHQYQESLKEAMIVCIPLIGGINLLHHAYPHLVHRFVGALDDIAGLLPNLWNDIKEQLKGPGSSDISEKDGSTLRRLGRCLGTVAMVSGLVISGAYALGTLSSHLMTAGASIETKALAGVIFALSCSVGAIIATGSAAFNTAVSLHRLKKESPISSEMCRLSMKDFTKITLQESVFGVPFRVGQLLVGMPVQIALGAAAGAFGFFEAAWFLTFEGIAENLFGAVIALSYQRFSAWTHQKRLKSM